MTRLHLVTPETRKTHKKHGAHRVVARHLIKHRFWYASSVGVGAFAASFHFVQYMYHLHKIAEISLGACAEAILSLHLEE